MKPPEIRFRRLFLIGLFAIFPLKILLLAETADFDGRPAIVLRNDKIELTILIRGAMLANLVLRDDAEKLSPYWNTDRAQRAAGSPPARAAGSLGHFLCLDGFGAPSEEERAAGMPFHGEASGRQFETVEESVSGASNVKLKVRLQLAQEDITRTVSMLDGESVVYVNTEVENLLAIDHPLSWAEHATIRSRIRGDGASLTRTSIGSYPPNTTLPRSSQTVWRPCRWAENGDTSTRRATRLSLRSMIWLGCSATALAEFR